MDWTTASGVLNIILGLIAIFQWWDRRTKNRAIENFVAATMIITERMRELKDKAIGQKAEDIHTNLLAIQKTVQGELLNVVEKE